MKPTYLRAPSKSRLITDPSSSPNLDSQWNTPIIKPIPTTDPPQIVLRPPSSSQRTANSRQPQTPLVSTEFLKKSIFDKLDEGLISLNTKSYNNIGHLGNLPLTMTTSITERVKSFGDNLKLQPLPSKKILNLKKSAQSVERGKNSVNFDETTLKGSETERGKGTDLNIEDKQMRYTKLMMFIPKNLESISTVHKHKPSFISFNDIAKTTKTTHPGLLEDLITKSATLKRSESREKAETQDQLDIMKNILKFNKLQKAQYMDQMNDEAERKLTPLRTNSKSRLKGLRNSPSIRIVPSRRLHEPMYDMLENQTEGEKSVYTNSPEKTNLNQTDSSQKETSLLKGLTLNVRASSPGPDDFAIFGLGPHNYKFFWYPPTKEKGLWKPDAREGHTLTAVGKLLVSYGGIGNRLLDKVVIYDSENDLWAQPEVRGDAPKMGRHNHTACEYKGTVVVFGGELRFNPTLGLRECTNDIYTFNPERCDWKYVKALGKIDPRRNHAATVYDKFMYVYGGISTEGTFLKDLWAYNFKAAQWSQMFPTGGREGGIAFHTMTACFNEKSNREKYKIAEEGLYVFGGKDEEGKILSTLKYLSISGKTCEWKYPVIKGPVPTARYNHVTLLYKPLQLLLIHGGRNEYLYEQGAGVCMNDIRILNLETMAWGTSAAVGRVPGVGRAHHGAALVKTTLMIFGGVTFCEYANPDLRQVEINQLTTRKLMREYVDTEEAERQIKTDRSGSPRTRRNMETQEEEERTDEKGKETKEFDFVSWQPLPLKQQFPIEDTLNRFRNAIRHTVLTNITKKTGKSGK